MSEIIENLIEKSNIIENNIHDDDIRDQILEIEEEKEHKPSDEELKEERKLKAIKAKMSLNNKREKKINVSPERVEEIMDEFIKKYNINELFDEYFIKRIHEFHNEENKDKIIAGALGKSDELLFDVDFFQSLVDWVKEKIDEFVNKELQENKKLTEDEKEVLKNLNIHIELTVDDAGIDKVTLIAWHYFLKNLEKIAREFIKEHKNELTGYNKQKIAIELYNKEITNILSNHPQMNAFANTIISITHSWMKKYHAKSSRLSKFIYELQLSDMYVMLNTIVRYLILIAIKNRNPLELRALMSTYISLIHRNIISLLSADITKVKIGYVAAVQYMFEEGERTHFSYNKHQMITDALVRVFKIKNKRKLKSNREIIEMFRNLSEINMIDFFEFMNPEFSMLDNVYLYTVLGYEIKNSNDELANGIVYSSKYKTKRNYQPVKKYFDSVHGDKLYEEILNHVHHDKTAQVFYNKIKNEVLRAVNPAHYINDKGETPEADVQRSIKELDTIMNKIFSELD